MDIVNFPPLLEQGRVIEASEIDPVNDLIILGKFMAGTQNRRDGSQYPNFAMSLQTLLSLVPSGSVNIYNSDGFLTTDRVATLGGMSLRWDMSNIGPAGDTFTIGALPPNFPRDIYPIQFQNNTVIEGTVGIGGNGGVGTPYLNLSGSAGTSSAMAFGTMLIRSGAGAPVRIQSNNVNTDRITVLSGGNVGISNNAPNARLHVIGAGTTSATINFESQNSATTAWFRQYDDGTIWSQSLTDVSHLITTFGNSMTVRYNGVITSDFTMQVNGVTKSSYVNQNLLSRFQQSALQDWGVYGSDNMPYLLFDESTKRIVIGATAGLNSSLEVHNGNIETIQIGDGFILKSPDGTRWKIQVSNAGALSAVLA